MDAACIDLSSAKGRNGMHYTALSRVRSPEGLFFQKSHSQAAKEPDPEDGPVSAFAGIYITTSKEVKRQMAHMSENRRLVLNPLPLLHDGEGKFTISVNNVSTLRSNLRHLSIAQISWQAMSSFSKRLACSREKQKLMNSPGPSYWVAYPPTTKRARARIFNHHG